MITTKGKLKVGLEFAGKTHVEFTIRAPKVKDTIEATAEVGEGDNLKFMLAAYSRQLISLGDIPKENITSALLADLYDVDLAVIQEASQNLEKKLMSGNLG
jgi:phage FluMu protein gp41